MENATQVEDKKSEDISENTPDKKQESLEDMLFRHNKAKQKAKKKQVDEDISKLSTTHAEELASIRYSSAAENGRGNLDNLVKAIAGFQSPLKLNIQNLARVSSGVRKDLNRKLLENKEYKKSRAKW
ncbi:unnamed protein product [Fraxinus pennsylvanica]|uniref:Uncharacterized protein n=1 Tax=Fraxinus pennsylvanica TaxID=56036 RepID=A0AAD1ZHF7_9LAMI|nr:unnamed protein product [Fraxinus pennsylvanica]